MLGSGFYIYIYTHKRASPSSVTTADAFLLLILFCLLGFCLSDLFVFPSSSSSAAAASGSSSTSSLFFCLFVAI